MIHIAICDDEDDIAIQIENMIEKLGKDQGIPVDIDVFSSGAEMERAMLTAPQYDLLFLDINMKDKNGIAVAEEIRKTDGNMIIVFVSGYKDYVWAAFHVNPFDFIQKPLNEKTFAQVLFRAFKQIREKACYYAFTYKGVESKILYKDILFFESSARKIRVYLSNGKMEEFNAKLSTVEAKLAEAKIPFLRIHQSYLVNYHMIKTRAKTEVTLVDGQKLAISERHQRVFGEEYTKLLGREISV